MGGDRPSAMGDADDVDPIGEEHLEDRVFAETAGDRHWNGPDAGDLARFAGHGVAPHQRFVVDNDMDHGA